MSRSSVTVQSLLELDITICQKWAVTGLPEHSTGKVNTHFEGLVPLFLSDCLTQAQIIYTTCVILWRNM